MVGGKGLVGASLHVCVNQPEVALEPVIRPWGLGDEPKIRRVGVGVEYLSLRGRVLTS